MAVYTDLTDEEREAVLAEFGLARPQAFKGIAEGIENSNFFLEAAGQRFILTIFERRVAEADLPFFMGMMEHLARKGFPAPRPLRTKSGGHLAQVRGKPCAIVTFLNGVSPKRPTAAHCRAIGATLARMHAALADFSMTRENSLGPTAWAPLIGPHLDLAETLRPGLTQSIAADLALVRDWRSGLPHGPIHADLFPDNALFDGDKVGGVIDFYFACTDALAYDIAVCLNAWCFENGAEFNLTKGAALFAGYQSVRPLDAAEREAIPALARGAAIRFFATRLADWSTTPEGALVKPKDPLEYADKLEFHRRAAKVEDYGG